MFAAVLRTVTVPAEGFRKPESMCSRVLLPAPLGPSSPVTPGETSNEISLTATTLPYHRDTPSSAIVGPSPAVVMPGSAGTAGR